VAVTSTRVSAFWLQGKMHQHDIAATLLDNLSAQLLVQCCWCVWGKYAVSINNGMAGANYALWYVFLAEVSMTCLLVLAIFILW